MKMSLFSEKRVKRNKMINSRRQNRTRYKLKKEEEEETFDKDEKLVTKYEGEDPKTFK